MTESRVLYEKIIKNDYCIGCGACASIKNSPFKMLMNDYGNIVATPQNDIDNSYARVLNICPFSDQSKNEDEISSIIFPENISGDAYLGRYLQCFAGYVKHGDFRLKGSSGGLGKWMGYTLLKENLIDHFIQVISNQTSDPNLPLFDYTIISDKNEVLKGSKSAYYPVTLAGILKIIKEKEGRYAITGVPCFIKALRLLTCENEIPNARIKYTIGIICGGMKSANQSKIIGWQLGVRPENLIAIDFRRKHKEKSAINKIYQVWSNLDNIERYNEAGLIFGTDWGSGFFKPQACDYCDDVLAETSDISLGDAWLPQFEKDPDGTTIIVVRDKDLSELLDKYQKNGDLFLSVLTKDDIKESQEGGFRHRREALSFRIAKKEKENVWHPQKRIRANQFKITRKRKRIYSLREKIAEQSHISAINALNKNDITIFFKQINPLIKKYRVANYGTLPVRLFRKIKRVILSKAK